MQPLNSDILNKINDPLMSILNRLKNKKELLNYPIDTSMIVPFQLKGHFYKGDVYGTAYMLAWSENIQDWYVTDEEIIVSDELELKYEARAGTRGLAVVLGSTLQIIYICCEASPCPICLGGTLPNLVAVWFEGVGPGLDDPDDNYKSPWTCEDCSYINRIWILRPEYPFPPPSDPYDPKQEIYRLSGSCSYSTNTAILDCYDSGYDYEYIPFKVQVAYSGCQILVNVTMGISYQTGPWQYSAGWDLGSFRVKKLKYPYDCMKCFTFSPFFPAYTAGLPYHSISTTFCNFLNAKVKIVGIKTTDKTLDSKVLCSLQYNPEDRLNSPACPPNCRYNHSYLCDGIPLFFGTCKYDPYSDEYGYWTDEDKQRCEDLATWEEEILKRSFSPSMFTDCLGDDVDTTQPEEETCTDKRMKEIRGKKWWERKKEEWKVKQYTCKDFWAEVEGNQ